MSLMIDVNRVERVLLADGWHNVELGTMSLDSYEYVYYPLGETGDFIALHEGGSSGVCATGFEFINDRNVRVAGPLTSVLAVECRPEE